LHAHEQRRRRRARVFVARRPQDGHTFEHRFGERSARARLVAVRPPRFSSRAAGSAASFLAHGSGCSRGSCGKVGNGGGGAAVVVISRIGGGGSSSTGGVGSGGIGGSGSFSRVRRRRE
jgi:hypothetical protein